MALTAGCAARPDPIPRYGSPPVDVAIDMMRAQVASQKTVRGEATINLTDPKGQTVSLDGAFAMANPGHARLRAWKFGQAVFDLTLKDGKAWAYLPREEAKPAAPGLRQSLGRWLALLGGGEDAFAGRATVVGDTIRIDRPEGDGTLHITVDRQTLTARSYRLTDASGRERFALDLSDYRVVSDGHVWPMTIRATSDSGVVVVRSREVEINAELPDAVFTPPARADVLP